MNNIKCCFSACEYNTAKIDLEVSSNTDNYGKCTYEGEISLIPCECSECGNDEDQMTCGNFVFKKENFMKHNDEPSEVKQQRMKCYIGSGVNNWNCYKDCAFWDGEKCTNSED